MYLQIWHPRDDTQQKSDQWKELIYPINHTFIVMQLIISLSVCIVWIQLLRVVDRKPHPTSMDMVRHVTPWMSYLWLESSDSHCDFKSPFYSLEKQVQWCWSETHGEDHFVIILGGLYIEMCYPKMIGNIYKTADGLEHLVLVIVISPSTAESFGIPSMASASDVHIKLWHTFCPSCWSTKLRTLMAACHQMWKKVWRVMPESPVSILVLCSEFAVTSTCVYKIYPSRHSQNSQLDASTWTISTMLDGKRGMFLHGQSWWTSSLGIITVLKCQFHCSEDNQSLLSRGSRLGTCAK